ncbi:hypothetical protein Zmor_024511 [Zophobas morio]|uniref:NACHT domain-containing protein n=1 Tax=Zophobas morio TaxID=2755281 RepID=A0AA38M7S7_9CUCU|nr:hypothetical protein Zmor_024511 [Zophobas morio]
MEEVESFKKRPGTTDKGKGYEDLVIANIALQLVSDANIINFHISSNDNAYGTFDDLVIKIETNNGSVVKAIQLKHSERKTLSTENLKAKKGDFSLTKYFKSYQELGRSADEFILFTNRPFNCIDKEKFQLEDEGFYIKLVKAEDTLKMSGKENCVYQFQLVDLPNVQNPSKIQEYNTFFDKFYLYADQENFDKLRNTTVNTFATTYSSSAEIFDKFFKIISEWNVQEGTKKKLNKKWIQRVIALQLVSSQIEPLSFGAVNDKMKLFREAIFCFDVSLFDQKSCETVKRLWGDLGKEDIDVNKLRTMGKYYQLTSSFVDGDLKTFSQMMWLMDKCPLILHECENVKKALQLCPDKKFILIGEDKNEEWMKNYSVFRNLSNLSRKPDLRQKVMQKFDLSVQGKEEIDLITLFGSNEEVLENVTTDNLVEMLNGPCYIGGDKEVLPQPYIDRYLSRNIINITYIEKFWENTIIILNCADNFDEVRDKLKQCKLIDINNFLNQSPEYDKSNFSNVVYVGNSDFSDLELEQIYNENREAKQFHYFKLSSDCNLEWIKSKGDVSDLDVYKLHGKYSTNENVLWFSRLDNKINLITGDPGMGKSELMKSFKNKCPPRYWTMIILPKDVHSFFYSRKFSEATNYADLFKKFIVNEKCQSLTKLDQRFCELCIEKNYIVFVWDALDEIVSEYLEVVLKIIVDFSTKGFLQWVTSRTHLKPLLEKKFSVLALSINQFAEQEQQNYVRKRLASFISVDEIEIAIDKIKSSFAIIEHVNILGIPLQIFMVTELFRQNKDKYLKLMENMFVLTDLYEYFIEEKFNNFYEGKLSLDYANPHMKHRICEEKRKALDHYERVAFKVIFPEDVLKRLNIDCDKHRDKILRKYASVGLVNEFENDVPHFVHGSFAEYLVATYFSKNFNVIRDTLGDIIFDAKYNNVRFFFDLLLAKNSEAHVSVLYKNYELLKTYNDETLTRKDEGGRSALHVISSWGQRHPRVKVTGKSREHVVHEDNNFDKKAETQAYFEIVGCLQNKSTVDEHDILLDMTPLAYARKSESLGAEIKLLQTKRNDLNHQLSTVDDVINIFYYSSLLGYDEVCELFTVEEKKRRNRWYETKFVTAENGETSLLLACDRGHLKIVKYLLQKPDAEINRPNKNGATPLYIASRNGHEQVVEYLVTIGAEINRPNQNGVTPLFVASQNGHQRVVEYLATAGAEINRATKEGATPLYIASQNGHKKVVEYLATSSADINRVTKEGATPLYIASQMGHKTVVEYLVTKGAEINQADKHNRTPLCVASQMGHEKLVDYLATVGADINRARNTGATPIYVASHNGHERIVEYLASAGAEINRPQNDGSTPLYIASQMGYDKIVEYLASVGADINRANKNGATPLFIASQNGHEKVVEYLATAGAEINRALEEGATPLYVASQNGHKKVVEYLVAVGAEINRGRSNGATPIYVASQNGHERVVEYLAGVGADVNRAMNDGSTPLLVASEMGHERVVENLAGVGAEISRANDSCTPVHIASQNEHQKVVEHLDKSSASRRNPRVENFSKRFHCSLM